MGGIMPEGSSSTPQNDRSVPLTVDVYFDLICPWCLIGQKRLDAALAERPGVIVTRIWHPFQLNPGMPRGGMNRQAYLQTKFGGADRAAAVYGMIAQTAERDGLNLHLDAIGRTPSTLDGHRLVRQVAQAHPKLTDPLIDRLFDAYFRRGRDIGQAAVLREEAVAVGVPEPFVATLLASHEGVEAIRHADAFARRTGIQAVPFFILNRRFAIAGAQEAHAILPLIDAATTAYLADEVPEVRFGLA